MNTHPIFFTYNAENKLKIQLKADVEIPGSEPYYRITNISPAGHERKFAVLPDITIKRINHKDKEIWVHADSNMPSDLSNTIGNILENTLPEIHSASVSTQHDSDDLYVE